MTDKTITKATAYLLFWTMFLAASVVEFLEYLNPAHALGLAVVYFSVGLIFFILWKKEPKKETEV